MKLTSVPLSQPHGNYLLPSSCVLHLQLFVPTNLNDKSLNTAFQKVAFDGAQNYTDELLRYTL